MSLTHLTVADYRVYWWVLVYQYQVGNTMSIICNHEPIVLYGETCLLFGVVPFFHKWCVSKRNGVAGTHPYTAARKLSIPIVFMTYRVLVCTCARVLGSTGCTNAPVDSSANDGTHPEWMIGWPKFEIMEVGTHSCVDPGGANIIIRNVSELNSILYAYTEIWILWL